MSYGRGAYGKMRAVLKSRIKHNTLESVFVVLKSRKQGHTLLLATFCLFRSFRSVPGFTNTPLEIYTCCEVHTLSEKYCVFKAPAVSERMSYVVLCCGFQDCLCYLNSDVMCHMTRCDWTTLYSVVEHGLFTQFTGPFPFLWKWVWPMRLKSTQIRKGRHY